MHVIHVGRVFAKVTALMTEIGLFFFINREIMHVEMYKKTPLITNFDRSSDDTEESICIRK